ncbi:hypothetical protein LCGC14_1428510 [marine sediment metagenome]|uniref:Uncharacterized protein n=1 Tax=marine sediment metagenome TaxID=412755 RepID=A0A0F9MR09_9ZZZZ
MRLENNPILQGWEHMIIFSEADNAEFLLLAERIPKMMRQYRKNIAESLQGMIDEGELDSNMRLAEIVQILLG